MVGFPDSSYAGVEGQFESPGMFLSEPAPMRAEPAMQGMPHVEPVGKTRQDGELQEFLSEVFLEDSEQSSPETNSQPPLRTIKPEPLPFIPQDQELSVPAPQSVKSEMQVQGTFLPISSKPRPIEPPSNSFLAMPDITEVPLFKESSNTSPQHFQPFIVNSFDGHFPPEMPLPQTSQRTFSDCTSVASEAPPVHGASLPGRKIYYRRSWTRAEDQLLIRLVEQYGAQHWSKLATFIPGKTGNQCSQRWCKALDPSIKKGKWSPAEDEALRNAVKKLGTKWKAISKLIPGRTGKQCRDRYTARLNPALKTGRWTKEEEEIVLRGYRTHGNKWATIQKMLPHRSWYTIKWKIESLTKNEQ